MSGIGGRRAGQRRQVANASGARRLVRLVHRRRRLVERPEFGGHAVVNDVETHGGQRHAGQYVHGTEPHGGRTGERHHVERPRRVPEPDGAEQHEAEEHAVQVRAPAAAVQPIEHGRAAADVRGHEREADQQQRHEARAVRRGRQLGRRLCRRRRGRGPVGRALEHVVVRVARSHVVRLQRVARERLHVHVAAVLPPLALQLHPSLLLLH